ncbi:hypothetical protein QBC38DRAFT_75149 [Podospora fimiseda]|uniref:Uncharacterized protein n=1 Tax=Podospora fimiseda TaxID=252190 RepID=A0AAN6YNL6_9PEZI|nr:hypothetical protein QBC38DRAFT_75149 [Podospora fimiseda]
MPSFGNRRQLRVPERLRPKTSSSPEMQDIIYNHPSSSGSKDFDSSSLMISSGGPTDNGSLLDYFDLPSPPSTPMNPTYSFTNFNSLNEAAFLPPSSPGLSTSSVSSCSSFSSPPSSPGMGSGPNHWPTASQRINRLPVRPRSSRSSSTSSADALADGIRDMSVNGPAINVRAARRTPYYPPNSSRTREGERARVFMNRGPHYVPNWTPLSSLPRHVQLQIEERMVRFTAI